MAKKFENRFSFSFLLKSMKKAQVWNAMVFIQFSTMAHACYAALTMGQLTLDTFWESQNETWIHVCACACACACCEGCALSKYVRSYQRVNDLLDELIWWPSGFQELKSWAFYQSNSNLIHTRSMHVLNYAHIHAMADLSYFYAQWKISYEYN